MAGFEKIKDLMSFLFISFAVACAERSRETPGLRFKAGALWKLCLRLAFIFVHRLFFIRRHSTSMFFRLVLDCTLSV